MEPVYIFGIALLAFIAISIILKFVKLALKIIGLIFLVLLIGGLFIGYSAYNEFNELRDSESPIVFLLEDAGNILAGFTIEGENFIPISQDAIIEISNNYLEGDINELKEKYLKAIIIDYSFIEENIESINSEFENLNKEEILNILNTNSLEEVALILSKGSQEQAEIILQSLEGNSIEDIKTAIFASATFKSTDPKALNEILKAYKDGNIKIVPEGVFKLIKLFPTGLIENLIENVR